MDNTKEFTHLGLCAGYGGIELGLHRVIRNLRSVALCEIEAFACANLVAKMEAGLMDCAPIWTDLKTFPWAEFRDRVDILTGGYPCQPFSAAGKRLGTEDPRHLWPFIASGIRILRPKLCFFENVEGHISLGLREVIGELERIGYQSSWGIFSASVDAGAPHQRKRVFILAVSNSLGGAAGLSRSLAWDEGVAGESNHGSGKGGGELADPNGRRFQQCESKPKQADNAGLTSKQAWPSRPGEPQHAWEPPRVVANGHRPHAGHGEQRPERTLRDLSGRCGEGRGAEGLAHAGSLGRRGRSDGDAGGLCGEIQTAGSCGCSAEAGMAHTHGSRGEEPELQHTNLPSEPSGCNAEAVGNSDPRRFSSGLNAGSSAEADRGGEGDIEQADGGAMGNAYSPRPQERTGQRGAGIQGTHADGRADAERQIEPSVGRDTHGLAGRLGYAELQVSCDNRTDELRLLGNGVVPATAERAFLTLMQELLKGTI